MLYHVPTAFHTAQQEATRRRQIRRIFISHGNETEVRAKDGEDPLAVWQVHLTDYVDLSAYVTGADALRTVPALVSELAMFAELIAAATCRTARHVFVTFGNLYTHDDSEVIDRAVPVARQRLTIAPEIAGRGLETLTECRLEHLTLTEMAPVAALAGV